MRCRGEDKPVSHETLDDEFGVHAAIGGFLTGGSRLLFPDRAGVAREPADPSCTAAAHCTGVRSVDVGPDTDGAGRVRRLRT